MAEDFQKRVLRMLDVLAESSAEHGEVLRKHRSETAIGFDRVDWRFGRLETRVETIEIELRDFRAEFERRITPL